MYFSRYVFPQPRVVALYPRGYEVSIPAQPGMTLMAFHGSVNKRLNGVKAGDISVDIRRAKNGRFVYRNTNTKLNRGDKLYFWLHVAFGSRGHNLLNQSYVF